MQIAGVSKDSVASHKKFKNKYSIPFPLIADADARLYDAFGVNARSTFLIDARGKIVKVWPKVKVEGHAEDVYASLI